MERGVKEVSEESEINDQAVRLLIGRWLFKILLGIIYAECRFRHDRSDSSLGSIFPPEFVEEMYSVHLLVNSTRKLTTFRCLHGPLPFTMYMYRIAESRNYGPFDFSTNLFGKSVAVRMRKLGAIAVADGGLQFEVGELGPYKLDGQELHPLQFAEIATRVHYKSTLRDATHFLMNSETPDLLRIEQSRVVSYSKVPLEDGSQRIFRDWNEKELSYMLPHYTRLNTEWYDEDHRRTFTFTFLPDGSRNNDFARLDEMLDGKSEFRKV